MEPFAPKSIAEHMYKLVAIDYFLKWVEAITLEEVMDMVCLDIYHRKRQTVSIN